MPKITVKDQTVQTGERPQANGWTDTHTHTHTHTDATKRIISPAMRSIKIKIMSKLDSEQLCITQVLLMSGSAGGNRSLATFSK